MPLVGEDAPDSFFLAFFSYLWRRKPDRRLSFEQSLRFHPLFFFRQPDGSGEFGRRTLPDFPGSYLPKDV